MTSTYFSAKFNVLVLKEHNQPEFKNTVWKTCIVVLFYRAISCPDYLLYRCMATIVVYDYLPLHGTLLAHYKGEVLCFNSLWFTQEKLPCNVMWYQSSFIEACIEHSFFTTEAYQYLCAHMYRALYWSVRFVSKGIVESASSSESKE